MTGWAPKVFWTKTDVTLTDGGWAVTLDGRRAKTPAKAPLTLPTEPMARAVAAEWAAQTGVLNPASMPLTRMANAAIDKVAPQQAEVTDLIAAYGASDLLCYRAPAPIGLIARQSQLWDPVLDWAADALGARLATAPGIVPIPQATIALTRLQAAVAATDPFRLSALHDLTALSGSLILALAVTRDHLAPETAWDLSRLDENWQADEWGQDDEALAITSMKRADFLLAARFFMLCAG